MSVFLFCSTALVLFDRAGGFRMLAQGEFLDFPGRRLGQFAEYEGFWDLEPGHVLAAEGL
jgi:hypothetical protein